MKEFLKSEKFKKLVRYGIVGVCTTAVNYALLWLLFYQLHIDYDVANAIAIVSSVLFAYVANKLFVFRSHTGSRGALVREAVSFFASRAVTALLEWGLGFVIHTLIGVDENRWGMVSKVAINVLVLVLNFVFSQVFVFRGKGKK